MKKVTFLCTTYRRFTCIERIIAQYYAQTYQNKELIIFNTDTEYPLTLGFYDRSITLINNDLDYISNQPYTNRGHICRDATTHATGDYFMLADDDDVYLPWHLQQAVEGIESIGEDAWKPEQSLFALHDGIKLVMNTMEASVIVKMSRIREIGFRSDATGYEGLSWYTQLRNEGNLNEHNKNYVPSYAFNWSDPSELCGHKQSGHIDSPNNFENHKAASLDYAKRPLTQHFVPKLNKFYHKYYEYLQDSLQHNKINKVYYNKYALHTINHHFLINRELCIMTT